MDILISQNSSRNIAKLHLKEQQKFSSQTSFLGKKFLPPVGIQPTNRHYWISFCKIYTYLHSRNSPRLGRLFTVFRTKNRHVLGSLLCDFFRVCHYEILSLVVLYAVIMYKKKKNKYLNGMITANPPNCPPLFRRRRKTFWGFFL